MSTTIDLLVRAENNSIQVLWREEGELRVAPDIVELNAEEGDQVRWLFAGRDLQILFGANVSESENTPFTTDTFNAAGNDTNPDNNGAIASGPAQPPPWFVSKPEKTNGGPPFESAASQGASEWVYEDFKYTINLTDLDGTLYTLDPDIRRWRHNDVE